MMELSTVREFLRRYDGPPCTLMEICGSHTAAIAPVGTTVIAVAVHPVIIGAGVPRLCDPQRLYRPAVQVGLYAGGVCGDVWRHAAGCPAVRGICSKAGQRADRCVWSMRRLTCFPWPARNRTHNLSLPLWDLKPRPRRMRCSCRHCWTTKINNVKLLTALKTMPPVVDRLLGQGGQHRRLSGPGACVQRGRMGHFPPLSGKIPGAVCRGGV